MLKICFIGKMRSGKSTAVKIVQDNFSDVAHYDFGDGLKQVVNIAFPPDDAKVKRRKVLQTVAQHMRKLDEDVWVNIVKKQITNSSNNIIIVTGCRQQNEYDMLKENGFIFIDVTSLDSLRIKRAEDTGDSFELKDFVFETELSIDNLPKSDIIITNNREPKEFEEKVLKVISGLLDNGR